MNKYQKALSKAESEYALKRGMLLKIPVYIDHGKLNMHGKGIFLGNEIFHVTSAYVKLGIITYYGYRLIKKDVFEFPQGYDDKNLRSYYVDLNDRSSNVKYPIPRCFYSEPDLVEPLTTIYELY